MSDRLAELRRQRALIEAHLAWLDREIAAASGVKNVPATPHLPPTESPALATAIVAAALKAKHTAAAADSPAVAAAADAILEEYRVPPDTLKTDVRKGCFLYFAAALVAVAVIVTILYFALRHD